MDGPLNPPRRSNATTAAAAAPSSPAISTASSSRRHHDYGPISSDYDRAHERDVSVNSLLADLAHDLDALNARELARLHDIERAAIAQTHALPNGTARPDLSTLSSSVDLHADTVLDELKLAMDLDDARHDPWTFHRSFSELSLGPQATPMPASLLGGTRALYSHYGASSMLPYSRQAPRGTDPAAASNSAPVDDAHSHVSDETHDDEEVVPFSRISVGEMDGIAHESQFSFLASRRPGVTVPVITPTSNVVTPDLSEPSRYFEDAPQASFVTPRSHTRSATATTTTASRPTSTAPSALGRIDGAVSPPSPPQRVTRSPAAHRAAGDDDIVGEMPHLLPSIHLDASASATDPPAAIDDPLERTVRPPRTYSSAASPDHRASPATRTTPSWSPARAAAPAAPRTDQDSSASDTSGLSMTVKAMTTPVRRTAAAAPTSPVKSAPAPPVFAPRASTGSSVTTTSPPTWLRDVPEVAAAPRARASPAAVPPGVDAPAAADESITDVPQYRAVVPATSTSPAGAVAAGRTARSPALTPTAAVSSTDTDSGLATAIDHLTRRVKALTDERGALAAECATLTADRDRLAHELAQTRDQVVSLDRDRAAKQLALRERTAAAADLAARVQSLERVVREQQEVLEEHRRLMARRMEAEEVGLRRRDEGMRGVRDAGELIEDRRDENAWRYASPAPASSRGSAVGQPSPYAAPREAWAAAAPAPPPRAASRDLGVQGYHQPYDAPAPVHSHPTSPAVHPTAPHVVPPSTTSSITSSPARPRTRRVREFSVQTDVIDVPVISTVPARRRSPTPTPSVPGTRHQHAADLHDDEADQARAERRARRARLEREIHRRVKQLLAAKLRRERDASDDDGASAADEAERDEVQRRRASAAPARRRTAEYEGPRPRSHSPTAASRARVAATHQHQHQHTRAAALAAPPSAPAPAVVPIPVPFVVGTATGKSHSVPVNLQRVLHLVKAAAPPPPVVKKPRKPVARRASNGPPVVRAADKPLVRNLSLLRSSQKMQAVLLQGGAGAAADGIV
ncbi:hypothetical protein GGF31_002772 [Allomyces arbusculus]|nr:hypothetical protein GGF31_002772 [Allomyces arbusculus]